MLFSSSFSSKILKNSACEGTNIAQAKQSLGSPDISWLRVITVISDLSHWITLERELLQNLQLWSFVPVGLCFITWLCLSACIYHVSMLVGLCFSRECACLCFITWPFLSACVYHVTVPAGLCLSRECSVSLCFITWPCLSVCALSRDSAGRSVFITWLFCQSVLYHVTVPVSLCSITWQCRPVCVYHVTVPVCVRCITWCLCIFNYLHAIQTPITAAFFKYLAALLFPCSCLF